MRFGAKKPPKRRLGTFPFICKEKSRFEPNPGNRQKNDFSRQKIDFRRVLRGSQKKVKSGSRFSTFGTFRSRSRTFGPEEQKKKTRKKKRVWNSLKLGLVELTIPGYPRRRAPDRPWAFRRPSPPLVVYRGTPISGGLEGVPRRGSWEGRKVPDFGFSGHFRVFWVFDGLAYICPFPHIGQIRAGLDPLQTAGFGRSALL